MSFLESIDTEKMEQLANSTKENAEYFYKIVEQTVTSYSKDLDDLMSDLYTEVTGREAISTDAAERYYAELTNKLYFMTTALEQVNVYSDMAKAAAKEVYSKAYLSSSAEKDEKGKSLRTVGENQSMADVASQYETVTSTLYEHAYKCLKAKIEAASEAVNMLKNILKRRMNEEYLSGLASSGRVPAVTGGQYE